MRTAETRAAQSAVWERLYEIQQQRTDELKADIRKVLNHVSPDGFTPQEALRKIGLLVGGQGNP